MVGNTVRNTIERLATELVTAIHGVNARPYHIEIDDLGPWVSATIECRLEDGRKADIHIETEAYEATP